MLICSVPYVRLSRRTKSACPGLYFFMNAANGEGANVLEIAYMSYFKLATAVLA